MPEHFAMKVGHSAEKYRIDFFSQQNLLKRKRSDSEWTGVKESKSREEKFAGFYDLKASQTTEIGLKGYKNEWSSHERMGPLSTDLSHSVGVNSHGVHFTDKVGVHAGNASLVGFTAPAVLLGGTNPYLESRNQNSSGYKSNHNSRAYTSSSVTSTSGPTHVSGRGASYSQGYGSQSSVSYASKSTVIDDNASSCCLPGNCFSSFFGFGRKSEKSVEEKSGHYVMNY